MAEGVSAASLLAASVPIGHSQEKSLAYPELRLHEPDVEPNTVLIDVKSSVPFLIFSTAFPVFGVTFQLMG